MRSYYKTLGIERTATPEEIKKAYRRLAFEHHPDRNLGDPSAEEKLKEINEAYAVLSNPEIREQYDKLGARDFRRRYPREDIFERFRRSPIMQREAMEDPFLRFWTALRKRKP
jgi:curved DNA-binding protein CbpA